MYRYDEFDAKVVKQRTEQFAAQVNRRLTGELSEEEFRPLRLMNGLYLQLHAYMLRVAIPYGTLNSEQMHMLGNIASKYDKGYGHFTTRQNIQYNWIKLSDTVKALEDLASVNMHAIQTSGNCIRNTTTDPWAGVAADEHDDPRPYCEFIRQWSTFHPEFSFLPRKFKIAMTGADEDRAAIRVHDIGIQVVRNDAGEVGFAIYVGGGQGRTPMVAPLIKDFVSKDKLLTYLTAVMRVYNQYGRRDNKYKARIKILVHELGAETFTEKVEAAYQDIVANTKDEQFALEAKEIERIETYFAPPADLASFDDGQLKAIDETLNQQRQDNSDFNLWVKNNVSQHKVNGYSIVNISLKPVGGIPGDATDKQIHLMADLGKDFSHDELRISHRQNVILPYVKTEDLFTVWQTLKDNKLASSNHDLASDIIACPGLDYCALATARSIPIAQKISEILAKDDYEQVAGKLHLNISGCINACGHHHVGNIGILGLNKNGEEFYQITLGGDNGINSAVGERTGPGFSEEEIAPAIKTIVDQYLSLKENEESFLQTYQRVGMAPFKEALYGTFQGGAI